MHLLRLQPLSSTSTWFFLFFACVLHFPLVVVLYVFVHSQSAVSFSAVCWSFVVCLLDRFLLGKCCSVCFLLFRIVLHIDLLLLGSPTFSCLLLDRNALKNYAKYIPVASFQFRLDLKTICAFSTRVA